MLSSRWRGVWRWNLTGGGFTFLEALPEYRALDEVAAVGEISITEIQHVAGWDLEEQKDVTRRQLGVAADHDLPAILHTPADLEDVAFPDRVHGSIRVRTQRRSSRASLCRPTT